jgi:hypothetical protein
MGEVYRTFHSSDNPEDTSNVLITYQFFSSPDSPYKDSINSRIIRHASSLFQYGASTKSTELDRSFFEGCAEAFEKECLSYQNEDYFALWWAELAIFTIDRSEYTSVGMTDYTFMGGAHPNSFTVYYSYDKRTGNRLTKSDFISDINALTEIAEPLFRELHGLESDQDLEEAGFWFENNKFALNENFYFEDTEMVFYFNSYEITAYAAGPTELRIPVSEIKHLFLRKH